MSENRSGPDRLFTPEDLARFNGEGGGPVYIAHGGKVIDVSESRLWKGGLHMRRHAAGSDLTADIQAAPHGPEVLERYPQVGVLPSSRSAEWASRPSLAGLLRRYPSLRRHPHPMTVHFPIAFAWAAAVFSILRWMTGAESLGVTAFHCLVGLALSVPVAAVTGVLTWRLNYGGRTMRSVTWKKRLTVVLAVGSVALSAWQFSGPDVYTPLRAATFVHLVLVFSLTALATVVAWIGAHLTFPVVKGEGAGGK